VISSKAKGVERKEVESLDDWTQEKVHGVKLKHDREVEELRNEVNRMILFVEDDYVNSRDQVAVEALFEGLATTERNEAFDQANKFERVFLESSREFPMIKTFRGSKYLSKTPKATTNSSWKGDFSSSTVSGSEKSNNIDVKSRLKYYKSLHEETENQLLKHIQGIENEIEKKKETALKISREIGNTNGKIRKTIQQVLNNCKTI